MDGPPGQQLSPTEEQEKWLHEAFKAVKQHAFYMKRALVRAPRSHRGGRSTRLGLCHVRVPRCRYTASASAERSRGADSTTQPGVRARPDRLTVARARPGARRMRTTCARH
jgi:hypothetical protein